MTRGDRSGVYAAVMTFFRKSTGALASWVAGILLSAIGFQSKVMTDITNTPHNIQVGIALIFFIAPVILLALALLMSLSLKLNRKTHEVLKREISRLSEGGLKQDVDPETKQIVEELTGHPYNTLWPDKPLF